MMVFNKTYLVFITLFLVNSTLLNLSVINKANANNQSELAKPVQPSKTREAQLIKNSKLYQQANNQSEVIETILANKPVVVHQRQQAWYFVATEQKLTGWLSMLNVRFNGVAKRTGELGVASAFGSLSKNTLPTQSTGIRGFDESDLKKAKANFEQLAIANAFQIPLSQVKEFAQQGQLKTNAKVEVK